MLSFKFISDFIKEQAIKNNFRYSLNYHLLILLSATILAIFYNGYFWEVARGYTQNHSLLLLASLFLAYILILSLALELICARAYVKFMLGLIFLIASISSFFIDSLSIGIDKNIIESLFNTSFREARDFINAKFILHILLFGILPTLTLYFLPLSKAKNPMRQKLGAISILSLAIICIYISNGKGIVWSFKENKGLIYSLNPIAPIRASIDYSIERYQLPSHYLSLGDDARSYARNKTFVLIIGESQRAKNYALNGYARDTNPYTSKISGLINFSNFYSCGVITAISIPCMLTTYTQKTYNNRKLSLYTDNLLDVAQKAGYSVHFISNNGGECMGSVCRNIKNTIYFNKDSDLDIDMLPTIQKVLENASGNTLVVINLLGSHGARYDLRYKKEFEKFTPTCKDSNLPNCTKEQIKNAYDNSIIATDFFVASVIKMLKNSKDSMLWFISDHGESLGENGQYMHGGFPYALAPKEQKHIASMIWINNANRGGAAGVSRI